MAINWTNRIVDVVGVGLMIAAVMTAAGMFGKELKKNIDAKETKENCDCCVDHEVEEIINLTGVK